MAGGPGGCSTIYIERTETMTSRSGGEGVPESAAGQELRDARAFLRAHRTDYGTAVRDFRWPQPERFNFALDWFDVIAAEHPDRAALTIVEENGESGSWTYAELSARSDQVAAWLRRLGVERGDRIILMLGNQVELWEVILGAIKLGAVLIPASTLLGTADLRDRVDRGHARFVVARQADASKFDGVAGDYRRISVGGDHPDWIPYAGSVAEEAKFQLEGHTRATDPLLLYFTSGTTALPKLVEHSHVSYPIGHLTTMYWLGLQPGDVHLNISSPGWAKHAWSNVFAPWIAGATVFLYNYSRFDAGQLMRVMSEYRVTTFCAPPTVWRMLIQADLSALKTPPREAVGAGEPLNPEVIEQVRQAWGVTIRDGFGQTETTLAIGNSPGQRVKEGSMGRPMPGFAVALVDLATGIVVPVDGSGQQGEGEICLDLSRRPISLMTGYHGDEQMTAAAMANGYYHTGDVGSVDADGYITYVGRADDVFKASDYRISPFELESVLLEHESVAEAAVVPSPDALRLAVPKAYVVLAAGFSPDRATASAIFAHSLANLSPYKRIRRLEFADLPKTISGKIRRVELRSREDVIHAVGAAEPSTEYRLEDFPELRSAG
jgi:acetyl-CoA synthetase